MYTVKTVLHRIANFLRSRKGRDMALVGLILLTGTASFGLGRLSALNENRPPVSVDYNGKVIDGGDLSAASAHPDNTGNLAAAGAALGGDERVVASKNGSVYHLPWCAGAQKIKEENKVWYNSPEAAKAAGLRPAGNCSGLK